MSSPALLAEKFAENKNIQKFQFQKFTMSYVDESLLAKIIDKFGVDSQINNATKTRLWAKVTKEYNSITGNSHTKARLSKKWQNIKAIRKQKRQKLMATEENDGQNALHESEFTSKLIEASEIGQAPKVYLYQDIGENMWNVMDYALRDLYLHLVRKYNVDETTNPRIKNELWRTICKEFHEYVGDIGKPQRILLKPLKLNLIFSFSANQTREIHQEMAKLEAV